MPFSMKPMCLALMVPEKTQNLTLVTIKGHNFEVMALNEIEPF